jgi:hypothetical protein
MTISSRHTHVDRKLCSARYYFETWNQTPFSLGHSTSPLRIVGCSGDFSYLLWFQVKNMWRVEQLKKITWNHFFPQTPNNPWRRSWVSEGKGIGFRFQSKILLIRVSLSSKLTAQNCHVRDQVLPYFHGVSPVLLTEVLYLQLISEKRVIATFLYFIYNIPTFYRHTYVRIGLKVKTNPQYIFWKMRSLGSFW